MGTTLSLILFAIIFCLVVGAYFLGHWIKRGAMYFWHITGERLHLHIPRRHAH